MVGRKSTPRRIGKGVCYECGVRLFVPTWVTCEACDRLRGRSKYRPKNTCVCGKTVPPMHTTWCSNACRNKHYQNKANKKNAKLRNRRARKATRRTA